MIRAGGVLLLAGAIAAAALELERIRRELELLARQDRHLELAIRAGDDTTARRVDELVNTFGAILPRVAILERLHGGDALRRAHVRLLELGTVRERGSLEFTQAEVDRLDAAAIHPRMTVAELRRPR